jgi:hypothetical protein
MSKTRIFGKLGIYLLCFLVIFSLVACGDQSIYDDDSKIANRNTWAQVTGVRNNTSSGFSLSATGATGVETIKNVDFKDNPKVNLSIKVNSGKFKLVAVKDARVYTIQEGDCDGLIETTLVAGKYALKIVGQNADVSVEVSYSFEY